LDDGEKSAEGAFPPCMIAAATMACAGALVSAAGPWSVGSFSALASADVGDEAGAIAPWLTPSLGLASRALPCGAVGMRAAADVAADASVRMPGACGTLKPEPGTAGPLRELPDASPLPAKLLPAEAGASPRGAETGAAASSKLGATTALSALAVEVGAAGIALGSAPAAPGGEAAVVPAATAGGAAVVPAAPAGAAVMAPAASAVWAAAKRSVFTADGAVEGVSAGGDAGTGGG
jgi:hypothetical protein